MSWKSAVKRMSVTTRQLKLDGCWQGGNNYDMEVNMAETHLQKIVDLPSERKGLRQATAHDLTTGLQRIENILQGVIAEKRHRDDQELGQITKIFGENVDRVARLHVLLDEIDKLVVAEEPDTLSHSLAATAGRARQRLRTVEGVLTDIGKGEMLRDSIARMRDRKKNERVRKLQVLGKLLGRMKASVSNMVHSTVMLSDSRCAGSNFLETAGPFLCALFVLLCLGPTFTRRFNRRRLH